MKKKNAPGNNLAPLEGLPQIFLDLVVSSVRPDCLLHGQHPSEDFLVRKAVQRTREAEEGSRIGQEWIGQRAADQV